MIPIILIADNKRNTELYIKSLIKNYNISRFNTTQIYPEKKEISIEQIRSTKKESYIDYPTLRLFAFHDFHTASIPAQNAFLKTLEEQSAKILFILITENEHAILPTVRSRSKVISLIKDKTRHSIPSAIEAVIEEIHRSNSYEFLSLQDIVCSTREESIDLFDSLIDYFRSKLATQGNESVSILKKILLYRSLLQYNNINPQLTVDTLLIFLKKTISMK